MDCCWTSFSVWRQLKHMAYWWVLKHGSHTSQQTEGNSEEQAAIFCLIYFYACMRWTGCHAALVQVLAPSKIHIHIYVLTFAWHGDGLQRAPHHMWLQCTLTKVFLYKNKAYKHERICMETMIFRSAPMYKKIKMHLFYFTLDALSAPLQSQHMHVKPNI